MPSGAPHPIHRRYYAEDLVRLRRAGESRRYAGSQRRGRIDPNPHQIEAVMFALRKIPDGGCALADEVGLGKTIEAGLVIAQLLAEGAARVLIVVPRTLLGQWQNELYTLFRIGAHGVADRGVDVSRPGVFLVGREYAGGGSGYEMLSTAPPFDLCIIDEAHEVFAGIYRRFDRYGVYQESSQYARTAHRVRKLIGAAPVLLLTATPIQNSLAELWGLIQYIEPTGTLLGSLPTFVDLFCAEGDVRRVATEQSEELRRRLDTIVKRTLRRQAKDFLEKPFVGRSAQLFEYSMSAEERTLYDDVTEYLLQPSLCAFHGRSRQLLLLGFHRRMASSTPALAQSLEKVGERLRRMLEGGSGGGYVEEDESEFLADLEDEEEIEIEAVQQSRLKPLLRQQHPDTLSESTTHQDPDAVPGAATHPQPDALSGSTTPQDPDTLEDSRLKPLLRERPDQHPDTEPGAPPADAIREELALVEGFVRRARALPHDSKAESLVTAVQLVTQRAEARKKVVIFTESLTTQAYLQDLLLEQTDLMDQDITLFRGVNDSPRATEALNRWKEEVAPLIADHVQPSTTVAMRLALVHEFQSRSKVLISTEAGAKGLNLQFCDTIINYDLPWNPQRIEQRIGRCHRYGQEHDVTVINFLAKDNEAQRLTFEILSSKLDLFGEVLDMSDVVLQTPRSDNSEGLATALGPDFEAQLRRIWDRARTVQEVEDELRELRDSIEERRQELEDVRQRTIGLIEGRLDESVHDVFRNIRDELPATLAELDADLERVLVGYLGSIDIPYERIQRDEGRVISIPASPRLPENLSGGLTVAIGAADRHEEMESLYVAHPLIDAAVAEARSSGQGTFCVRFDIADDASGALKNRRGSRGRLALTHVSYRGSEREDRLKVTAVFENTEVLQPAEAAHELLKQACTDVPALDPSLAVTAADLDEVVDEELFLEGSVVARSEQESFEKAMDQLDQYMEDRILVLRRGREGQVAHLRAAEVTRDRALGPDARGRAESVVQRLTAEVEAMDQQLERLTARDDDVYARWKQHAHQRRFEAPRAERLFEVEFVLE